MLSKINEMLSEKEIYKLGLAHGLYFLKLTRDLLFFAICNVAMEGKLNYPPTAINLQIDFPLDEDFIQSCNDINVDYLYNLLKEIDNTIETIININNLNINQYEFD